MGYSPIFSEKHSRKRKRVKLECQISPDNRFPKDGVVSAFHRYKGKYCPAKIKTLRTDGKFEIIWLDGDFLDRIKERNEISLPEIRIKHERHPRKKLKKLKKNAIVSENQLHIETFHVEMIVGSKVTLKKYQIQKPRSMQ
eukprot:UN30261